ncbi:hypothetical protein [Rhizobium sp. BR 362]|uniref:hypothetical protein n=1 Tax=Rhizobium sp. BR 362 TaxID=3040670 RepID=UPI002F3F63D0
MSKKRLLAEAEKRRVHDEQMALERLAYPHHDITIMVEDETDNNGEPKVHIIIDGVFVAVGY